MLEVEEAMVTVGVDETVIVLDAVLEQLPVDPVTL
jgi:hypothetical protein